MPRENRNDLPHLVLTELPQSGERYLSWRETLEHQVKVLLEAWQSGQPDVATLLRSHGLATGPKEEHGFRDWQDWEDVAEKSPSKIDARFEAAADAVVGGAVDTLQTLLRATPELARARSS